MQLHVDYPLSRHSSALDKKIQQVIGQPAVMGVCDGHRTLTWPNMGKRHAQHMIVKLHDHFDEVYAEIRTDRR
jgi:hypothetical protein